MSTLKINLIDNMGNVTNTQYIEEYAGSIPSEGEKVVLDQNEFYPKILHDQETFVSAKVWSRAFHFPTNLIVLNVIIG